MMVKGMRIVIRAQFGVKRGRKGMYLLSQIFFCDVKKRKRGRVAKCVISASEMVLQISPGRSVHLLCFLKCS